MSDEEYQDKATPPSSEAEVHDQDGENAADAPTTRRRMIQPINEAMLTPGQLIMNGNLRFINNQAEKIIAMTSEDAPQRRNEVVPNSKEFPTQTRGFLHPSIPLTCPSESTSTTKTKWCLQKLWRGH
ncbi:hypothetical protein LTR84_008862 [Exophiala bonariae]|uniref:Uncharacterized protein n=1 Tax=Exophiala bonariae TaxID=1690606 RepID=A0AAV9MVT7_9EURO|nr:hypothetical protein LTR84_008862 [Exophiala bonariae]